MPRLLLIPALVFPLLGAANGCDEAPAAAKVAPAAKPAASAGLLATGGGCDFAVPEGWSTAQAGLAKIATCPADQGMNVRTAFKMSEPVAMTLDQAVAQAQGEEQRNLGGKLNFQLVRNEDRTEPYRGKVLAWRFREAEKTMNILRFRSFFATPRGVVEVSGDMQAVVVDVIRRVNGESGIFEDQLRNVLTSLRCN
jgi:hypothetical protein